MRKGEEERSLLCLGKWITPKALSKDVILPVSCGHLTGDAESRMAVRVFSDWISVLWDAL